MTTLTSLEEMTKLFNQALVELGFTSIFDGMHYIKDNIAITRLFNRYVVGNIKGGSIEPRTFITFISKEELEQAIKNFEECKK